MSLLTADYDYPLPEALIARYPLPERAASRMMVIHREEGRIEHASFRDFPRYLRGDDLVVLNNTKVIPARVYSDDGKIELFFLEVVGERRWKCLVKPGRKMRLGRTVPVGGVTGTVVEVLETGERVVEFETPVDLHAVGHLPLPPYFERESETLDEERYQTVYAAAPGAVAAPTAGLHFTPELLASLPHAFVTLHVGAGTFKPVQSEKITDHPMHTERFLLPPETVEAANRAGRIIAVGTTTMRVLEARMRDAGALLPGEGSTDIFIYPPYQFQAVGALLTNFHLPKSTLLMLVSAFAGRELIRQAYEEAIRERYRFYSYGDCMLIL
ncbi:MAG TPA: tRNA preQ1(34) S-adenosylmethionine ribosyltransferase-isomerase QueA [Chthoniobacteraceae bacterium]|nr:tRNA preQ1(34) S-adenosylmethionine ribosyltransferase-isomerase QueA [Chthoniobacteraceae bacterium]